MNYAWIAEQSQAFPLTGMCDVLNVSVSGHCAWRRRGTPDRKRLSDSQMLALIRAIHAELEGAYGSPAWSGSCEPEVSPPASMGLSG